MARKLTAAEARRLQRVERVLALEQRGLTMREIADEVGVSAGTVHRWLRRRDEMVHDEGELYAVKAGWKAEARPFVPPPVKVVNRRREAWRRLAIEAGEAEEAQAEEWNKWFLDAYRRRAGGASTSESGS